MIGELLSHYRILEEIRRGGMGIVYRALDVRLQREVAIKLLPPELTSYDPRRRARFIREAQAAAALDHPYIGTVFEVDESRGTAFIAMELIRGQRLADAMAEGKLPTDRALTLAMEMAEGLACAHGKGILHRDLKPANVMLTEGGHVKIIDFGLAKLLRPLVDDQATTDPTASGVVKGTLAYMSPEQLRAEAIDERSDIFSFGILFYEMLTGRPPFRADNVPETMQRILHDQAESLEDSIEGFIVPKLQPIIDKCLYKDPARRFESATALLEALAAAKRQLDSATFSRLEAKEKRSSRRLRGVLLGAAVAIGIGLVTLLPRQPKSIAILPWEYEGPSERSNLAELVPLALNDRLRAFSRLQVTPFAVSQSFQPSEDPSSVASQLGVDWVLSGQLRIEEGSLAARLSLVDAGGGRQSMPDSLRGDPNEILALTNEMSSVVLAALDLEPANPLSGPSKEALERYLEGKTYLEGWDVTQNAEMAEASFRRALEADDHFAEAYAGMALAQWNLYQESGNIERVESATRAANQAVVLDPSLSEAHLALGVVELGRGRSAEAAASFEKALELAPADDAVCRRIGDAYDALGRSSDAEAMYQRAIALRPGYWENYRHAGTFYFRSGRPEKAKELFSAIIRLRPESDVGYTNLAATHILVGEHRQAEPLLRAAIRIQPTAAAHNNLGMVLYATGRFAEAARELEQAALVTPTEPIYLYGLGDAYRQLERGAEASRAYGRAVSLWKDRLEVNASDVASRAGFAASLAGLGRCAESAREAERSAAPSPSSASVSAYLHYVLAVAYSICDDSKSALAHAKQALQAGALVDVRTNPDLQPLLDEPELRELLR